MAVDQLLAVAESNISIQLEFLKERLPQAAFSALNSSLKNIQKARLQLRNASPYLIQTLGILDRMDDDITEMGGDEDERGRRDLARIRRAKDHLRKIQAIHGRE